MDDLYMSDDRYLAALERQRARIADGLRFVAYDCDDIGAKETHAAWGLCSKDREAWPDREDHLFPADFDDGRVAPKYMRGAIQRCPMDRRPDGNGTGCFYSCRIFKHRNKNGQNVGPHDRQAATGLYDQQIVATRAALAKARGTP